MPTTQTRRRFLATVSLAAPPVFSARCERPPPRAPSTIRMAPSGVRTAISPVCRYPPAHRASEALVTHKLSVCKV